MSVIYAQMGRFLQTLTADDAGGSRSSSEGDRHADDANLFWGINLFVLVLLSIVFCVCWRCQHSRLLRGQQVADIAERLEARLRAEEEKKYVPPEKRRAQLLASFARNNVTMTVHESDLCDDFTEAMARETEKVCQVAAASLPLQAPVAAIVGKGVETAPTLECRSGSSSSDSLPDTANDDLDVEIGIPVDECNEEESDEEDDVDEKVDPCETGYLLLRSARLKRPRPVPNCCAICICSFEKDEVVVWSSNRHCKHAFHLDCMMDWLIKSFDETPCPCCRQDFTDLVAFRKEQRIKWDPKSAFNPSVLVLRSA